MMLYLFPIRPLSLMVLFMANVTGLGAQDLNVHTCPEGKMDYSPGHSASAQKQTIGFDLTLQIREQDWYDPSLLGTDAKDWLKAGGVSYYSVWRPGTWPKNRLSALVGFRMLADQQYQVCAYVNDREGKWKIKGITTLKVGETTSVTYRREDQNGVFTITTPAGTERYVFTDVEVAYYQLAVGPWHGGTSAAPVSTALMATQTYPDE